VPASLLARVAFVLLVLATLGAFFATARLKGSRAFVEDVRFPRVFSPNGDGREDAVALRFSLPDRDRVTVRLVDARGDVVRTFAEDVPRGRDRGPVRWRGRRAVVRWDGRSDAGRVVPDGVYRLRVVLREEGRSITHPRELRVDTRPPAPRILAATPPTVLPGAPGTRGRLRIRFEGPQDPAPTFRVWRTDVAGAPRQVACFHGPRFRSTAVWDGYETRGCLPPRTPQPRERPAADGVYAVSVTVEDKAGNRGSAPPVLPPRRERAARRGGVQVRYLSATGPLVPVAPGAVARIAVGPVERRLRWSLARLGGGRVLGRGRAGGDAFGVRVPREARTGLHLLRIQAGGRRAIVPLAVRSPADASRAVLVVLPAITWQGQNLVDDDRDGFADTLEAGDDVRAGRPFAHGRLPAAAMRETLPLLRLIDREGLRYDLTTDLALARDPGALATGAQGIVFPGSARWLTEELDLELRRLVEAGARVASFGVDAFRRRVTATPELLAEPSAPEPRNVFGEAVATTQPDEPVSMLVGEDEAGLFAGTDGFVGLWERFEVSRALPSGVRVIASAAPPEEEPAFVAYRLGRGIVVRVGTPEWAAQAIGGGDAADVTARVWRLVSR
jgi:hypothetical protein